MQPSRRVRPFLPAILLAALISAAQPGIGQNTPIISGAVGFFSSTNKGPTSFTPLINPVVAFPITHHFLFETRDFIADSITPRRNGLSDQTKLAKGTSYLQLDYLAAPHLNIIAGKILTPFGTYNERLSPIWIGNFQDAPLIFPIGVAGSNGVGGEIRGSAFSSSKVNIDYAYYFFGQVGGTQFTSSRSTGGRVEAYFPSTGVEIGTSFGQMFKGSNSTAVGAHFWWEPPGGAITVRSEYAHSPHSQGYWIETGYRLSKINGPNSFIGRFEPLFRMQQTFRNSTDFTDGLPSADLQQADFGLDYFLPHNARIITSYSRQFSSIGNGNMWKTGIVYRFLYPAWPGKVK